MAFRILRVGKKNGYIFIFITRPYIRVVITHISGKVVNQPTHGTFGTHLKTKLLPTGDLFSRDSGFIGVAGGWPAIV